LCGDGEATAGASELEIKRVFVVFCAVAGLVASPIVLILTVSILYAQSIPKNVKIGHAVLGLLSLSFWVCTICFSGPLIRW